jgi:hypothetical protein
MNQNISRYIFVAISMIAGQACAQTTSSPESTTPAPVLIELYTSQGCSSCPPAEALLNSWGMDLFKAHRALPLAFHVDYWDNLGWKDSFSAPFASERQRRHTLFYNAESSFTPEMIVNGQLGFNGSDAWQAKAAFDQASTLKAPASIPLRVKVGAKTVQFSADLQANSKVNPTFDPMVNVVVFENSLSTSVQRGENAGALLQESFVVRYNASEYQSKAGQLFTGSIPIDPSWKLAHAGVAIWIQDPQTMQCQGVNWIYPLREK